MTQSDANCSPRSDSVIIRENTGNYSSFWGFRGTDVMKTPHFAYAFSRIPWKTEQGI